MKTYLAKFNPKVNGGVYAISLVENPAMEGLFIALSKQEEIKFAEVDKEQRILMGLVLEPNKPIYRNQNGEEFNIVFNEDTIKDLSHNFFKSSSHKNSSLEHDDSEKITGVTFVESWIVEDSKKDKSANFGFSYPKGSWIATMKVDNDEIWNDYVKTGKVKGFSIDAMLSLKEVNLKSEISMSEIKTGFDTLTDRLMVALNLKEVEVAEVVEVKVSLGMMKSAEGNINFEYEGEVLEAGVGIVAIAEDGSKIPVPVGEYELEDGSILAVAEEGIVASVGQPEVAEAPAELEQEPVSSAPVAQDVIGEVESAIKSIMIKYAEDNKVVVDELKAQITELKNQVVEFSEQPAAQKIKSQPQVKVELNSKGRILNKLRK